MVCDSCNKQLRDGAKFCGQCGAKTKRSASAPVAGKSEQRYELNTLSVNATGPDTDGDLSVEIKVSITNRSGSDWDQVNTRTQLISASGFIEETSDTYDLSVEDGATEEFDVNFYGVKARPFMANPELTKTIINVVACSATSKKLTEFALPENSFEVVKMEPCEISDSVRLLSGGIWRADPDDDKDVRVEAKWLVQNLTNAHIPEVRFTAEVVGKSGAEIGDAGGYGELRQFATAVIGSSTYSKEKKLKGANVQVSVRTMTPLTNGASEHFGMDIHSDEVHTDSEDMNTESVISPDDFDNFRESFTECDPANHADRIALNDSPRDFMNALASYVELVIEHSDHHGDYVRDACRTLITQDGPYSGVLAESYRYSSGESIEDDEAIESVTLDDLRAFITEKDNIETYEFAYRYLECLSDTSDDSNSDPPHGFDEDPHQFLKSKMVAVFSYLSGNTPRDE